jgi:TPR repeat protein
METDCILYNRQWYLQAAGADPFPLSFHALGDFYHYPNKDPRALRYYLISAECNSNCHESHYQLGVLYQSGVAVPMNIPQAVQHFSQVIMRVHCCCISF